MKIVLFEDELWTQCSPLVYTRPLFELRCGAFTLKERVTALLHIPEYRSRISFFDSSSALPTIQAICRPHLMGYYGPEGGNHVLLKDSESVILINGRVLNLNWLPDLLNAPTETVYLSQNTLVGAHLSSRLASAILYYLFEQRAADTLEDMQRFARIVETDTACISYPWDLITQTGEQLVRDLPLLAHRLPTMVNRDPTIVMHGDHIYIATTARLDGPIVLDARDGPIFIDEQAHIEPFSFIQGPCYIGKNSLIASARIRSETSIGPVCRIGGEVEASTVQGYSNKHHEGFLGHSWIGEWVNIGAMTTNSDLKNTYGSVRVTIDNLGSLDSGVLKLGTFLADHVKLGIGLHLMGGSVIGIGSNIYGVHMVPKTVPPFTWGGEVFREHRIDSMISVTRKVMGRRKKTMSPQYEEMLRAAFAITHGTRDVLQTLLPSPIVVESATKQKTSPIITSQKSLKLNFMKRQRDKI